MEGGKEGGEGGRGRRTKGSVGGRMGWLASFTNSNITWQYYNCQVVSITK